MTQIPADEPGRVYATNAAVGGLVLGISGLLLAFTPLLGLACGVVAAAVTARAKRNPLVKTGMVNAAAVLAVLAIIIGGLATLGWLGALISWPWLQHAMPWRTDATWPKPATAVGLELASDGRMPACASLR